MPHIAHLKRALTLRQLEGWGPRAHQPDPYPGLLNRESAPCDAVGATISSLLFSLVVYHKLYRLGSFGLAALGASHSAFLLVGPILVATRREAYVAHRELLVASALLHCCLVSRCLSSWSPHNVLQHHSGSPLLLLALFLLSGTPLYTALYCLYGRMALHRTLVVLPAVTLLPLTFGRSVCHRVLAVPDAEAPLAALYHGLSLIHAAPLAPSLTSLAGGGGPALQQCLAVDAWVVGLVGVALPLVLVRRIEARERRLLAARPRLRLQHASDQGDALLEQGEDAGRLDQLMPLSGYPGGPLMELWLASCLLWGAAAGGAPLLHRWSLHG